MMNRTLLALALVFPLTTGAAVKLKRQEGPLTLTDAEQNQPAQLLEWFHPVYPPELKAEKLRETVRVRYIVDENGVIVSPEILAGDQRFHAAALAAIKQWKYQAPSQNHKAEPLSYDVEFTFQPGDPPEGTSKFIPPYKVQPSPHFHPEELRAPDPVYPKHLESRQLFGEVELNLGVNKQGRVEGVEIVRATHADFLATAFATVEQWEFRPAHSGNLSESGEQIAVLSFTVMDADNNRPLQKEWLENNGITLREAGSPKAADFFDEVPVAVSMVDPIYPHELLGKGVEGTAKVDFSVDHEGLVTDIAVVDASEPDFGAALAAAMIAWRFKPLYRHEEITGADFSIRWKFIKPNEENTPPESLAALSPGEKPISAKELDRPLSPIYRRSPVYPKGFLATKQSGQADIEVIINQSGRVCWPRIVNASQTAFGWAAATALSRWYFETPLKAGKPVSVRVVIPIRFDPK